MLIHFLAFAVSLGVSQPEAPVLPLPPRRADALGGEELARQLAGLDLQSREEQIWREVISGNVPDFLRRLKPVTIAQGQGSAGHLATFYAAPDYLALGSDGDYLYIPLTPFTAQRVADRLGCVLPTPRMVDQIYSAAAVKLDPHPIPPTPAMTTVPVFLDHNRIVREQRAQTMESFPLGTLTAGDKKDIVVCKALLANPGHVAIYGWHLGDGRPIQPLYLGHFATWADYSHGTRLIDRRVLLDGRKTTVERILRDPKVCDLLSDEGALTSDRYRFSAFPQPEDPTTHLPSGERVETLAPIPGVRVLVDEPTALAHKVRLVIYALPNGNTIEQTFGRHPRPGLDWHYGIQQIAAQTRFLRGVYRDESLVVAYLEAESHSWPAWLRGKDPAVATHIIDAIVDRYRDRDLKVVLDSHSGGGALIFAYLHALDQIPQNVDRIAFLDSEYAYDTGLHAAKLAAWLRGPGRYLCVVAYNDTTVVLNGKHVVTPERGTWGRSHAMLTDLGQTFQIKRNGNRDPERFEGLDGRITFLLKQNPKGEIFHTVQVERNGFIESVLSGTDFDGKGYRYFGKPAYSRYIGP